MNSDELSPRVEAIAAQASMLPKDELLELHREVCKLAARVRMNDPQFRSQERPTSAQISPQTSAEQEIARREERRQ